MIKSILVSFFRNIKKNKFYYLINILGLTVSLGSVILILLYVKEELSYDVYHRFSDQVYRVAFKADMADTKLNSAKSPVPLASVVKNEFPEVLEASRLVFDIDNIVQFEEKTFVESIFYADSTIIKIFSLPFIKGDPQTALIKPLSIILTETTSKKYFGSAEPIGKVLRVDSDKIYTVTGVIRDIPENSHVHFNFLATFLSSTLYDDERWERNYVYTYLLIRKGADIEMLNKNLSGLFLKYSKEKFEAFFSKGYTAEFFLQPLKNIHLYSNQSNEIEPNGNINIIRIFLLIAILIIIIASVNFTNLSTAIASARSKEVAVRKISGSSRLRLFRTFQLESFLLSFSAVLLSVLLAILILPLFNSFAQKQLEINFIGDWYTAPFLILLSLVIGFMGGIYSSVFLSSLPAIIILKGHKVKAGSNFIRDALVVLQFVISVILLSSTFLINNQLKYVYTIDLGFNKNFIIVMEGVNSIAGKKEIFREELLKHPGITNVSCIRSIPARGYSTMAYSINTDSSEQYCLFKVLPVDFNFIKLMNFKFIEGRDFSKDINTDSSALIINETAVKRFGLKDPQNSIFRFDTLQYSVIGVVKDYHIESLHRKIEPVLIRLMSYDSFLKYILIKVSPGNIKEKLTFIENKWKEFAPDLPFRYYFFDEDFNKLYQKDEMTRKTIFIFAILSMLIACLGLIGVTGFIIESRTKEIGIRKSMGASVANIVMFFLKRHIKLVIIANVLAFPIVYYCMNKWLQNFEFRTDIDFSLILIAFPISLLIVILMVSYQVIRASNKDPVKTLRYE